MGAFVEGEFVRVRWRAADPELLEALNRPDLTALECDQLLEGADEAWGLAPGDEARIIGDGAPDGDEAGVALCPSPPLDLPAGGCVAMMLADAEPGWTALMIAAARGDVACVSALLGAGADPLLTDNDGRTALDLARLVADPNADDDLYDPVIVALAEAEREAVDQGVPV